MSEMVERVAKAMCLSTLNGPHDNYKPGFKDQFLEKNWKLFTDRARVAISAMYDLTDEMIVAGDNEFYEWMSPDRTWTKDLVKVGWKAMIDTALK